MNAVRQRVKILLALAIAGPLASPFAVPRAAIAENGLGRLFFTPAERAQLDRQRMQSAAPAAASPGDRQLRIDGQLRRSSGKSTVWINGEACHDEQSPAGESLAGVSARPAAPGAGRVRVDSGDAQRTLLKVGETLERGTRRTRDLLDAGSLTVHRPPAAGAR